MPHKPESELLALLDRCPPPGLYRHFRGGVYTVITAALAESDHTPLVIYRPVGGYVTWARPLASWNEEVEHEGRRVPRFRPFLEDEPDGR